MNFQSVVSTLLLLSIAVGLSYAETQQCKINVNTGMNQAIAPLVIKLNDNPEYVYPEQSDPGNLVFAKNEEVTIFCPGRTDAKSSSVTEPGVILIDDQKLKSSSNLATLKCLDNGKFELEDHVISFAELSCEALKGSSYGAIMRETGSSCANAHHYEIGYALGDGRFLRTIDFCHDRKRANTLWSHAIVESIDQRPFRYAGVRVPFKIGSLYADMAMSKYNPYSVSRAFDTLSKLFGSASKASEYLSPKLGDRKYLAKGHLIANADKFYKSEQESTMFLANTVPMFQSINAPPGNWFFVEEYVRRLAHAKNRRLEVWAGGLGTITLEGTRVSLYVRSDQERIPVPRVLYKCVVSRQDREGVCFLVVNNPYLAAKQVEKREDEFVLCRRQKSCEKAIGGDTRKSLGYTYCCGLKDFYARNYREEAGLEGIRPFVGYKPMTLA